MRFFVLANGKTSGPFTSRQLRELADAGRLSLDDQVRKENEDKWYPAHKVGGLFDRSVADSKPVPVAPRPRPARPLPPPAPVLAAPQTTVPSQKAAQGLGIGSLGVGALAVGMCWLPLVGFSLAGVGLFLGFFGLAMSLTKKGPAIAFPAAGSALGLIAFVPNILFLVLAPAAGNAGKATSVAAQSKPAVENVAEAPAPAKKEIAAPQPGVAAATVPVAAVSQTSPLEEIVARSTPSIALIQGKSSSGTGFVIESKIVATNKHVIDDEQIGSLKVYFPSAPAPKQGPFPAKLLYEDDLQDLAFLRVETPIQPLPTLDDYKFRQGQEIIAIGNPGLGNTNIVMKNAVAKGIMSSETSLANHAYYQLSISINPGNSGGPVLDDHGRVLGVVTLKASKNEGMAFCIPVGQLRAAYARSQTLSPDEVSLVEQTHQSRIKQESDESVTEFRRKLVARGNIDPALRGRWRLQATSGDGGRTSKTYDGVPFANTFPMRVEFPNRDELSVSNVYIFKDDLGHPGNLVFFTSGTTWLVTKTPDQPYILVQVVGLRGGKTKETFRLLVTAEGEPVPFADAGNRAGDQLPPERGRMTTSRTTTTRPDIDVSPREDRMATVKYSGQLRSAERSIRAKRYSSAKAVLLRIIKDAPGTTVATQAERLLDSISN